MTPAIARLENPIRHYRWGSTRALAQLQRRPVPSAEPEAELWIGDHPVAPSSVVEGPRGAERRVPLPLWLARDPAATLGPAPRRNGDHLPFLAKILAAAHPLSLQVHPDAAQARDGYAREEAARTPAERRCYRDAHAKHELLIALSPFDALCGLRPDAEVEALVERVGGRRLGALAADVRDATACAAGSLAGRLLSGLQRADRPAREKLCAELAASVARPDGESPRDERYWIGRLAAEHPDDPLAAAPLLLNLVSLAPGDALRVAPRTLHTYLEGVGVEVMTPSDNVVRAGLSTKHVDLDEFERIARTTADRVERERPAIAADGAETVYATGTEHFDVAALALGGGQPRSVERAGGRIAVLVCVDGDVDVRDGGGPPTSLAAGDAAIVPASTERYTVAATATARVFVVRGGAAGS